MDVFANLKKFADTVRALLSPKPVTFQRGQRSTAPRRRYYLHKMLDDVPPFGLWTVDQMLLDPVVCFGLAVRNGPLLSAEIEIEADDQRVAQWVQGEWDRIKQIGFWKFLRAKRYGYAGYETFGRLNKEGQLCLDRVKILDHYRIRPLTRWEETIGLSYRGADSGNVRVYRPKVIWLTYQGDDTPWGYSLLRNSHIPFLEKWGDGGGVQMRRHRIQKDAWIGDIFRYPDEKVILVDGTEIHAADLVRELGELRMSGGMMRLPSSRYKDGNLKYEYEPPRDSSAGSDMLFRYVDDLDIKIWYGEGVPKEVIEASETGSGYSGRAIPFEAFLGNLQMEFDETIEGIARDWLQPVSLMNFGTDDFTIRAVNLVEKFKQEGQQQEQPPQQGRSPFPIPGQQEQPQFSDDIDQMGPQRAPSGGVTIQGKEYKGGEFIPGEAIAAASREEKQAVTQGHSQDRITEFSDRIQQALADPTVQQAAAEWGETYDNQLLIHSVGKIDNPENRLDGLEARLGLDGCTLNITKGSDGPDVGRAIKNMAAVSKLVQEQGQRFEEPGKPGKEWYYLETKGKSGGKGAAVIVFEGKIQTVMPYDRKQLKRVLGADAAAKVERKTDLKPKLETGKCPRE